MGDARLDLVIAGVGGQGVITLATLIAEAALARGTEATVAETHGLSQRGGSVVVHVRIGRAGAPLIKRGGASLMLALDALEAARYAGFLHPGSTAIVENHVIRPPLSGVEPPSPGMIESALSAAGVRVYMVNARERSVELGNPRAANVYLLGYALGLGAFNGVLGLDDVRAAIGRVLRRPEQNIRVLEEAYREAAARAEAL